MRGTRPLLMTALVSLFLAEGQRAFFGSLFGLGYQGFFPVFRVAPALLAAAFLLTLLAPLLPLARWLDRRGAVAAAAVGSALFRVPMTHPSLETRLVGGALVVAAGAVFLTWAVGYLDRRALAGGVVIGLVVDQLLRLAGSSYDLSLQPGWLPVQAALSLGLVVLVVLWARNPRGVAQEETGPDSGEGAGDGDGLERRAGGLRLRGALALGALLFLDLHVVGLAPVVASWSGVEYAFAGAAVGLAGAAAIAAILLLRRPTGGRTVTLLLVALSAGSAIAGYWLDGVPVALLMAGGHMAALLLVSRALDPASGRRSGGRVVAGLAVFVAATILYGLTFYAAFTLPFMEGQAPWIFGAAGLLLAACFILLPRPAPIPPPRSRTPTLVLVSAVGLLALGLSLLPARTAAARTAAGAAAGDAAGTREAGIDAVDGAVRVATWNLHFGFDQDWRFDPAAVAGTLDRSGADVVALQEVPVGVPTAYGIDLPLWLARKTRLRAYFSPNINGLLGDAFLTRLEAVEVGAIPLPSGGGDRKQLLRMTAPVGGERVGFYALHLGVREAARSPQMREALAAIGPGPAVILGDLNAEAGSPVTALLDRAGFQDAFGDTVSGGATFPADDPTLRIDWIWARGMRADSARVLPDRGSDHRAVVATLHILEAPIRSDQAHDLQTP